MILIKISRRQRRINFFIRSFSSGNNKRQNCGFKYCSASIYAGIPSQLLTNRPDIKQAELELAAAKLDVKVARAEFFPSFGISAG
jgi:outer membrane protein TolC